MSLKKVEKEVKKFVSTIKDDPDARLRSREEFYKKFGASDRGEFGYGNSEIAFMKWENDRVIRSSDASNKGSEWWSAVNLWFIYLSELGVKAKETGIPKSSLHNYLVGTEPSMSKLLTLSEFFGCSIDYLVTGKAVNNSMDQFIKDEVFKGVFEVTIKKIVKDKGE